MTKYKAEKQILLKDTQTDVEKSGRKFNKAIFIKAYAKLKRWCCNAYGDFDLEEWMGECGSDGGYSIMHYYDECEARIFNTSNREVYNQRREKQWGKK